MRRVASWTHIASSSAMTSNISISRCGETRATTAPRRGRISIRPSPSSRLSASRIGVRDTSNRLASSTSSSRLPGNSFPVAISSSMASRRRSESLVMGGAIVGTDRNLEGVLPAHGRDPWAMRHGLKASAVRSENVGAPAIDPPCVQARKAGRRIKATAAAEADYALSQARQCAPGDAGVQSRPAPPGRLPSAHRSTAPESAALPRSSRSSRWPCRRCSRCS
jgi:hypothetical protein